MIVTGMLAWYNEHPATLHRAVTSLACIADRLVAADGRWEYYPGTGYSSPPEQYQAIEQAAQEAGITATIDNGQYWTGQVAKRNHLLQLAQPSDWLLPLDADWELSGDREAIRQEMATTRADVLKVPLHTPSTDRNLDQAASTQWHKDHAGTTVLEPLLFRNLPGIRIEDRHWHYSAIKDGKRVSLWGSDRYPTAKTRLLKAPLVIHHWCLHRDERTIQANREYCERRDQHVQAEGHEP